MQLMDADVETASGSFGRLVAILDVFAGIAPNGTPRGDRAPLGVSEVSRALGLSKGTISRYLRRLESAGILQRLPDRRYVLGSRVYEWGQAAAPGTDIRHWARPVMEHLATEFGETVSLLVREGEEAVCIDQVDGLFTIRLSASVGRHLSLHAGSSPRVLLAFAPEDVREQFLLRGVYPRYAPGTMTDAVTLRCAIEEARRDGYVLSQDELDEGAVGISAPIQDATGRVRAAIGTAGPESRLVGARRAAVIAGVLEAAAMVSRALGHRPIHDERHEPWQPGIG